MNPVKTMRLKKGLQAGPAVRRRRHVAEAEKEVGFLAVSGWEVGKYHKQRKPGVAIKQGVKPTR